MPPSARDRRDHAATAIATSSNDSNTPPCRPPSCSCANQRDRAPRRSARLRPDKLEAKLLYKGILCRNAFAWVTWNRTLAGAIVVNGKSIRTMTATAAATTCAPPPCCPRLCWSDCRRSPGQRWRAGIKQRAVGQSSSQSSPCGLPAAFGDVLGELWQEWAARQPVGVRRGLRCHRDLAGPANQKPSNDGLRAEDVAQMAGCGGRWHKVTLQNVRNFDWRSNTDYSQRWETRVYDLKQLNSVDMIMSYWRGPAIAHMLVSFGFATGEHVAFSVEIRRDKRQGYSEVGGFFKKFGLSIIAADERDVVRVRTNVRGEDAYFIGSHAGCWRCAPCFSAIWANPTAWSARRASTTPLPPTAPRWSIT